MAMRVAIVVVMVLGFGLGGSRLAAAEECETPLPEYEVTQPDRSVLEERAHFVGVWKGKWDGKLCHTFVVEWVKGDEAQVIYSYGIYEPWRITEPGQSRHVAKFRDDKLQLPTFRNGADASYRFTQGDFKGRYVNARGGVSYVKLTKVNE